MMFTIKWNSLNGEYKTTFENGWKRLNSCNASTYEREHVIDSLYNSDDFEYMKQDFYLVSYCTPIIAVKTLTNLTEKRLMSVHVFVNNESWNCSNTTIRQLSRFLNYLHFFHGIDLSYQEIKECMNTERMKLYSDAPIKLKYHMWRHSTKQMRHIFNEQCPPFTTYCNERLVSFTN